MVCYISGRGGQSSGNAHEAATCGKRQRASAMDGTPGAGSAQAVGVVPGGATAVGLAAAIDAAPVLLTPGVQIGGPQGLAFDCRYANLAAALYYGRYVRQGRLSDKGFHKFKPSLGSIISITVSRLLQGHQPGTSEANFHYSDTDGRSPTAVLFIPLLQVRHSGAQRGQKGDDRGQLVEVVRGGARSRRGVPV